jgi:tetratricopeptide (TPR) repeat protein
MIDMAKIDKLFELMRRKDWSAAHAMLDENELASRDEPTVAHWRAVVLREEGRYEEALQYLADNLHRFHCKTSAFRKRAELLRKLGSQAAALEEIEKAPFDSEIEDHWALVVDAKYFRLYLMVETGLPIPPEQWAEIPDDYISLLPTGERTLPIRLSPTPTTYSVSPFAGI